jgi:hypothetical protein
LNPASSDGASIRLFAPLAVRSILLPTLPRLNPTRFFRSTVPPVFAVMSKLSYVAFRSIVTRFVRLIRLPASSAFQRRVRKSVSRANADAGSVITAPLKADRLLLSMFVRLASAIVLFVPVSVRLPFLSVVGLFQRIVPPFRSSIEVTFDGRLLSCETSTTELIPSA